MSKTMHASSGEVGFVGAAVGLVYLIIGIVRGQWVEGVSGAVIIALGLALAYGLRNRSEAAQLLSGPPTDERQAAISTRASAMTGQVLCGVLAVSWLAALATGSGSAETLGWLCFVGGVTFIGATVVLTRRG